MSKPQTSPRRGPREHLHPVERSVRWLLAAIDRLEVPSVVLRGDRDLPRLSTSGALAVACAPRHAAQFERMLQRAAARYGVQIVARHRAGWLHRFQLQGVDASRQHRIVQLDLHTAEACSGVPILSARQLLQGRTRKRGHARPDVVISALVDFLGPYLAHGAVRAETLSRLATVLEQWPAQTRELLGDLFGTRVAEELTVGLRSASRAKLFRCAARARRAALGRAFASAPLGSLVHLVAFRIAMQVQPPFLARGQQQTCAQPPSAQPHGGQPHSEQPHRQQRGLEQRRDELTAVPRREQRREVA